MFHIVSANEGLFITCLYYGSSKENLVERKQFLAYGDNFKIGNQCKYIKGVGWFLTISINHQKEEFARFTSIEKAIETKAIMTSVELQIELSILRYQLDKILMKREREKFYSIADKYSGVTNLFNKVTAKQ